jgi:hypothetical protein
MRKGKLAEKSEVAFLSSRSQQDSPDADCGEEQEENYDDDDQVVVPWGPSVTLQAEAEAEGIYSDDERFAGELTARFTVDERHRRGFKPR